VLAHNLDNLRLAKNSMDYDFDFDISSVDEESRCFTKLKTLSLQNIRIDLNKILSKCSKTLKSLDLNRYLNLENLDEKLSCLDNLSITRFKNHKNPVKNLLSKVSGSLKTLKLVSVSFDFDMSSLLEETLKITTLELESEAVVGLALFLNKCPLVQNLIFVGSLREEGNRLVLKDLRKLTMKYCLSKCTNNVLREASKSSVKSIHLEGIEVVDDLNEELEFPVIPELDTIWTEYCHIGIAQVSKLFPHNAEVL
jgi:hypothetical protein